MTRPPEDTGSAVPPYEGRKQTADSDDAARTPGTGRGEDRPGS